MIAHALGLTATLLLAFTTTASGAAAPDVLPIVAGRASGARVLNRAVVFRSFEQAASPVTFDLPGEGDCGVLVCGVSGGQWRATLPDGKALALVVPAHAGCVYFHSPPGRCELAPHQP